MQLDPHIAVFAIVTMGVGYVMTLAGVQKNALEWRRRSRTCPSCGHEIRQRTCKCASGA
jgi:NADH pyrophosphatase NudC (nudix superfamily)